MTDATTPTTWTTGTVDGSTTTEIHGADGTVTKTRIDATGEIHRTQDYTDENGNHVEYQVDPDGTQHWTTTDASDGNIVERIRHQDGTTEHNFSTAENVLRIHVGPAPDHPTTRIESFTDDDGFTRQYTTHPDSSISTAVFNHDGTFRDEWDQQGRETRTQTTVEADGNTRTTVEHLTSGVLDPAQTENYSYERTTDADGNVVEISTGPDNTTSTVKYPDGSYESRTEYSDGSSASVTLSKHDDDGSFSLDTVRRDGSTQSVEQRQTAEGTWTRTADSRGVDREQTVGLDGTIEIHASYPDGAHVASRMGPDGTGSMIYTDPNGEQRTVMNEPPDHLQAIDTDVPDNVSLTRGPEPDLEYVPSHLDPIASAGPSVEPGALGDAFDTVHSLAVHELTTDGSDGTDGPNLHEAFALRSFAPDALDDAPADVVPATIADDPVRDVVGPDAGAASGELQNVLGPEAHAESGDLESALGPDADLASPDPLSSDADPTQYTDDPLAATSPNDDSYSDSYQDASVGAPDDSTGSSMMGDDSEY